MESAISAFSPSLKSWAMVWIFRSRIEKNVSNLTHSLGMEKGFILNFFESDLQGRNPNAPQRPAYNGRIVYHPHPVIEISEIEPGVSLLTRMQTRQQSRHDPDGRE